MIEVLISFDTAERIKEIQITGHAPIEESYSLECAVVSTIVEILSLELKEFGNDFNEIKEKGLWRVAFPENSELQSNLKRILFAKLLLLKKLSQSHSDTVNLKIKEE
ncbi:MAG: ribosomal-processing cysteine protease Prp [Leptospiraceae bacterium]|nr:ribosomal-processing cysteine protease Prp [Leptospiraceae bacterium]MDW7975943.1 ribosomal-processing cysteine protease Prp [Leptospiraceae bacterium]